MKAGNDAILKDILKDFLESPSIRPRYNQLRVSEAWNAVVGTTAASYTKSVRLRDEEVTIEIESAPLRQEFLFRKVELLRLLNQKLGEELVKTIEIL